MSQSEINKILLIVESEYLDRIVDLDPTTSLLESIGYLRELIYVILSECDLRTQNEIHKAIKEGICRDVEAEL